MKIAFTCGDPHSINIEAFLRIFDSDIAKKYAIIGIGSSWQLTFQAEALRLQVWDIKKINHVEDAVKPGFYWIDPWALAPQKNANAWSREERGLMARLSLESIPKNPPRDLVVLTAPIEKFSASLAGFKFSGQTEFFEDLWSASATMMLAGPKLRVALATNHLALNDVSHGLNAQSIALKLSKIANSSQRLFEVHTPKIGVCGLNPHCGDFGLFGDEEEEIIKPGIKLAQVQGVNAVGPFPADTIFHRALQGEFDVVLAMYHDQGLGPLKTVHFYDAVNISVGLPRLRVSPDHGPASDLYLSGKADMTSFKLALQCCTQWLNSQD